MASMKKTCKNKTPTDFCYCYCCCYCSVCVCVCVWGGGGGGEVIRLDYNNTIMQTVYFTDLMFGGVCVCVFPTELAYAGSL